MPVKATLRFDEVEPLHIVWVPLITEVGLGFTVTLTAFDANV